ncbi:MAG TPA: serine/threonine-protein kinase, partial [Gemmataceae bacterium]|nr:serine/threonine-protein kinase [Gemmataceae bacterium]
MNDAVAAPPDRPPDAEASLDAVVTAYLKAVEDGHAPDRTDWLARHPALAGGLVEFFADLDDVDRLARPLRAVAAADPVAGLDGRLGDYRLLREVGRGGMGVVYEAEQISLGRRVALKVLPFAATMDPKHLQRFHNEAKAAASLHHEHIVPVYAVGCERGVHYYAMQFIDGATLAQVIDELKQEKQLNHRGAEDTEKKRLTAPVSSLCPLCLCGKNSFRTIAGLIADAADALEYAHSVGIVHRDVKPGNLMLDGAGKVWVTDFGLARFGTDAGLTMTGDVIGTLRYMAPEQALAKHGLVDHRADVYGLGATLYELLTGRPAVGGEDKQEILRRIAFEEPVALRKVDKAIPAELETITLKCLAKEPTERYATAGELAADLRRFVEDKPIKAKPPTLRQRAVKWSRRHAGVVAAAAAALLVVLVAVVVSATVLIRQKHETDIAYGQVRQAYSAARDALDDLSSQVVDGWLVHQPELTPEHRAFLQRAVDKYERFAALADHDEASRAGVAGAYMRVGDIRDRLGQPGDAEVAYRRATDLYQQLATDFPAATGYRIGLGRSYRAMGGALMRLGQNADAASAYRQSLAIQEQLVDSAPADPGFRCELAGTCLMSGNVHYYARNGREAELSYRRGIKLLEDDATSANSPSCRYPMAQLYIRLGLTQYSLMNSAADAEKSHRRGIELLEELVKSTREGSKRTSYQNELATGLTALAHDLGNDY